MPKLESDQSPESLDPKLLDPDQHSPNNHIQTQDHPLLWLKNLTAASALSMGIALIAIYLSQISAQRWPDYASMQTLSTFFASLRWFLGDMSEAQFYKSEWASVGLILGALLAYAASRKWQRWQGFQISYATGLFPWILFSSTLGLIVSNLLWDWTIVSTQQWQPTFVTFVSLPAAIVLMYGRGYKIAIIGALLGVILVTPSALLLVRYVCQPLGLPNIIANVVAMGAASLLAFYVLYRFPRIIQTKNVNDQLTEPEPEPESEPHKSTEYFGPIWTIRRMLADFSESQFFANEWASIGFLLGVFLAIYLNPLGIAYGSGLIAKILISQCLASALAVVIWRKQWQIHGWYPTYIPISSVAPACVLYFQGSFLSIALGASIGAIVAPPLAHWISKHLAAYQHPYIGNVFSMAISTLIAIAVIQMCSAV